MNNFTIIELAATIGDYFKGFFESMECINRNGTLMFWGLRNGLQVNMVFDLSEINGLAYSFHHRLEDIKGSFIRQEQQLELEKEKAAN